MDQIIEIINDIEFQTAQFGSNDQKKESVKKIQTGKISFNVNDSNHELMFGPSDREQK